MYAYWVDDSRQFLVWGFLNEDPTPLKLNEDAPNATTKVVMAAAEVAGTF
jgi:hypothetical protein